MADPVNSETLLGGFAVICIPYGRSRQTNHERVDSADRLRRAVSEAPRRRRNDFLWERTDLVVVGKRIA